MPSEPIWMPLETCLEALIDYRGKTPEKMLCGVPLITAKVVKGGVIETPNEFIAEDAYSAWMRRGMPKVGDVLLTTEAPLGEVAQLKSAHVALAQRIILLRGKSGLLDNGFLKYFFMTEEGRSRLQARATGTTVVGIKQSELRKVEVPVPPIEDQKAIAETLGVLDDKVALLRETNATLEAIAQALFKSWFVDFDPVRAKAEGRDPEGVPPEVADLFPSEFEDSELGEIPKGWRVGVFADITDVVGGATPSTKEPAYWEGGRHCWATPKDLSGIDTPVLLDTERKITDAGLAKISSGLLPVGTVLMSSRAPIGYLAIAEVPVAVNQGFIAMKPKAGISNLFLLNLLRVQMDEIKSHANGSTFMEISKAAFRPLKLVVPSIPVIQAFDDVARSLYERMVGNVRQIASLTCLRDTLLPRLVSGKLRIPLAGVLQ